MMNQERSRKVIRAKGTFVELDNISPYIQDAVISTEDRGFYQHKGYSIRDCPCGCWKIDLRKIGGGGGGSTIAAISQKCLLNARTNVR